MVYLQVSCPRWYTPPKNKYNLSIINILTEDKELNFRKYNKKTLFENILRGVDDLILIYYIILNKKEISQELLI